MLPTGRDTVYLEVKSSISHLIFPKSGYLFKKSACLIQKSSGALVTLGVGRDLKDCLVPIWVGIRGCPGQGISSTSDCKSPSNLVSCKLPFVFLNHEESGFGFDLGVVFFFSYHRVIFFLKRDSEIHAKGTQRSKWVENCLIWILK